MKTASPQQWLLLTGSNTHRAADLVRIVTSGSATLLMTTHQSDIHLQNENRLQYSQDLTNAVWTKTLCNLTSAVGRAPDGTMTALRMTETADGSPVVHAIDYATAISPVVVAGQTCSFSVFLSASGPGDYRQMQVRFLSGGGFGSTPYVIFDASGTIPTTVGALASGTSPAPYGWWRCWFSAVAGFNGIARPTIRLVHSSSGNTYQGDGRSGLYVWGLQVTTGTTGFPGNYVATTSATASSPETYGASSGALDRMSGRTAQGEISSLDLTIHASGVLLPTGVPMHLAAVQGAFDGAPVTIRRVLMSEWGDASPGYQTVFEGSVGELEVGATDLRLTARSRMSSLERALAPRIFQPSCPYILGDSSCRASLASGTVCDKTRPTCHGTFNNLVHFGGFADVPPPRRG